MVDVYNVFFGFEIFKYLEVKIEYEWVEVGEDGVLVVEFMFVIVFDVVVVEIDILSNIFL